MARQEMQEYGFNLIIRQYAGYPDLLSLPCHFEHGWTALGSPLPSDLGTKKAFMLVYSKRRQLAWQKKSDTPVAIMGAPFVHYRRMHGLRRDKKAKGTVAFPSHSCEGVEAEFDIERYCKELNGLPDAYRPVTVCLHYFDFVGNRTAYERNGFDVVTAGDSLSPGFPGNFYRILGSHCFATSNTIGSYTFYAVEMGIPFFILGEIGLLRNLGKNPDIGTLTKITDYDIGRRAFDMFDTGPTSFITSEQREFTVEEVGVNDCLSPRRLKQLLIWYKLVEWMRKPKQVAQSRRLRNALAVPLRHVRVQSEKLFVWHKGLKEADKIFSHMTRREKIALYKCMKRHFSNMKVSCVEIGSYLGASSCFIAAGLGEGSRLYCVDTWLNDAMKYDEADIDAAPRDTYSSFVSNTRTHIGKIVPIRLKSVEAIELVPDSIEFLFLDGDHSYEGVKADWDCYSERLHSGSIVVFHDTGWAEGVKRVVQESVLIKARNIIDLPNMQGFLFR